MKQQGLKKHNNHLVIFIYKNIFLYQKSGIVSSRADLKYQSYYLKIFLTTMKRYSFLITLSIFTIAVSILSVFSLTFQQKELPLDRKREAKPLLKPKSTPQAVVSLKPTPTSKTLPKSSPSSKPKASPQAVVSLKPTPTSKTSPKPSPSSKPKASPQPTVSLKPTPTPIPTPKASPDALKPPVQNSATQEQSSDGAAVDSGTVQDSATEKPQASPERRRFYINRESPDALKPPVQNSATQKQSSDRATVDSGSVQDSATEKPQASRARRRSQIKEKSPETLESPAQNSVVNDQIKLDEPQALLVPTPTPTPLPVEPKSSSDESKTSVQIGVSGESQTSPTPRIESTPDEQIAANKPQISPTPTPIPVQKSTPDEQIALNKPQISPTPTPIPVTESTPDEQIAVNKPQTSPTPQTTVSLKPTPTSESTPIPKAKTSSNNHQKEKIDVVKNPPVPAIKPNDTNQLIENLKKQLRLAKIVFSTPDEMKVGEAETVKAYINDNLKHDLKRDLERDLKREPNSELKHKIKVEQIQVSDYLTVKLTGGNDFDIKAMHDENRLLQNNKLTQWSWSVTPKKSGEQTLTLIVYARVKASNGSEELIDLETFKRPIKVAVDQSDWFKENWLSIIEIAIALGGTGFFAFIVTKWKLFKNIFTKSN